MSHSHARPEDSASEISHPDTLNGTEPRLVSLQIGQKRQLDYYGKEWKSAICKSPVVGRLPLHATKLEGDQQASTRFHGGPNKAVCCYSAEHYPYWQDTFGLGSAFTYGAFGENFTLSGLPESEACLGDIFRVGSATIQICQPRQPCRNVARRWDRKDLPGKMADLGWTGYYLRVLETGDVGAGDSLFLLERSHPDLTILTVNRAMYQQEGGDDLMRRLATLPIFAVSGRKVFQKRV